MSLVLFLVTGAMFILKFILLSSFFVCTLQVCPSICVCKRTTKGDGGMQINCASKGLTSFLDSKDIHRDAASIGLKNNLIGSLPKEDPKQKWLHVSDLDLRYNRISNLDNNVLGLMFPKLIILDLSHNLIDKVTKTSFNNLTSVLNLHLEYNKINSIELDAFVSFSNLFHIFLNNNVLDQITVALFENMTKLFGLELSNNHIKRVYSEGKRWPKTLTKLNLANNSISIMPKIPEKVVSFNLTKNPIFCECKPADFVLHNFSTYCNVKFSCQSYNFTNVGKMCGNETYVMNFWNKFKNKSKCQQPKIEHFDLAQSGGDSLRIVCEASGYPAAEVTITYYTGSPKVSSKGSGSNVTVVSARDVKNGTYFCNATNVIGSIEKEIEVVTPEFLDAVTTVKVFEGMKFYIFIVSFQLKLMALKVVRICHYFQLILTA